jgi:hypothetical protein
VSIHVALALMVPFNARQTTAIQELLKIVDVLRVNIAPQILSVQQRLVLVLLAAALLTVAV